MNSFLLLLILEIVATINAGLVFQLIEKPFAGLIAGSVFCLVALCAIWIFYKQAVKWRAISLALPIIFLLGFALPLLIAQGSSLSQPIETVFEIPVQAFHRTSEGLFFLLMIFTFVHFMMNRKGQSAKKS